MIVRLRRTMARHVLWSCSPNIHTEPREVTSMVGCLRRAYPVTIGSDISRQRPSICAVCDRAPWWNRRTGEVPVLLHKTWITGRRKGRAEPERLAPAAHDPRVRCGSTISPATRYERERQWLVAPILDQRTDFSGSTQRELKDIAHRLNTRPRTCRHFARLPETLAG